jgi:preprotein translocase subunit SecA
MTGTAETESTEFKKIYNLDVVIIPTNNRVVRTDHPDVIYKTEVGKFKAVADEIEEKHKKGQPVLVGTTSVEKSELLHEMLRRRGVPHEILNAKNHEREASIIAQAGRLGSVTVSTNMAGRGVDILLGGDPATPEEKEKVVSLGGLCVIGTERHESRRIDNQLRGRSGRQGDVGESRFYISMQDSLMRIFGGSQIEGIMNTLGIDDSVPVASGLVSKSIERAQKRVESFNFDRRKQVVEMDDVMNVHRQVIYKLRDKILNAAFYGTNEEWLIEKLKKNGGLILPDDLIKIKGTLDDSELLKFLAQIMVPIIDSHWIEHLVAMNQVRDGIGLKGYAQRDPMVEYKREGHERFEVLINKIYTETVTRIRNIQDIKKVETEAVIKPEKIVYNQDDYSQSGDEPKKAVKPKTVVLDQESKIGRNDPCFCGSGKKFKNCHGKS